MKVLFRLLRSAEERYSALSKLPNNYITLEAIRDFCKGSDKKVNLGDSYG